MEGKWKLNEIEIAPKQKYWYKNPLFLAYVKKKQ